MKASAANPLTWLASLKLTVVLLALGMYLIFVGTLAQVENGIWQVIEQYFRSLIVWVPLDVFRALLYPGSEDKWPYAHPFPGGFLIIGALLVNLIAAHALRFKIVGKGSDLLLGFALIAVGSGVTAYTVLEPKTSAMIQQDVMLMLGIWAVPMAMLGAGGWLVFGKGKAGIVLVHAGLILMLLGEFITGLAAKEGQMWVPEFGSSNVMVDIREAEIAFVSENEDGTLEHVIIPESMIQDAELSEKRLADPALPLTVRIDAWMANSDLTPGFSTPDPTKVDWTAIEIDTTTGTEQAADRPSAVVTLYEGEKKIGQHLLSTWEYIRPTPVTVQGKDWLISLRFKETPLNYTLQLNDFRNDQFTGTTVARNYSSTMHLQTPDAADTREVLIKMNQPLRYDGKAFFQAGFFQQPLNMNLGTVLQVADNPGAWVPYLSCVIVTLGLTIHFVVSLLKYGRRANAKAAESNR